jgi:hypothetical protein
MNKSMNEKNQRWNRCFFFGARERQHVLFLLPLGPRCGLRLRTIRRDEEYSKVSGLEEQGKGFDAGPEMDSETANQRGVLAVCFTKRPIFLPSPIVTGWPENKHLLL